MDTPAERPAPWRSAAALGLVAMVAAALLAGTYLLTRQRIEEQESRARLQLLNQLVEAQRHDNLMHEDRFRFRDERAFPGGQVVTAYRARRGNESVAVVLRLAAPDGYSGPIELLVGINHDGILSGVRVTSHRETPGLGDWIELEKSDWVLGFDGRSLDNPEVEDWRVKRDGGKFDHFTGATITPRAVVAAVRRALQYFAENRDTLFNHPAEPDESDSFSP